MSLASIVAASSPPAGGAAIGQVIGATLGAMVATAGLIWIIMAHRSGRIAWVGKLADFAERQTGLPGWASLPSALIGGSLLIAVFGMYWDISIHIDEGRDPGPLANPAHYFILVGLFGVFFSGVLACAIPKEKPSPSAIRLPNGWQVPLGGLLIAFCGATSLAAFPLDDIWHRLFGQDVTLWGPTHIQMIAGASLATLALFVLQVEAVRTTGRRPAMQKLWWVLGGGAFLVGLSTLQGEVDYGVPQFRQLYHPVLIMLAAGIGLVAVRLLAGRGSAIGSVLVFFAIRGTLTLVISAGLGRSLLHFPLYVPEALLVELVALRVSVERPM